MHRRLSQIIKLLYILSFPVIIFSCSNDQQEVISVFNKYRESISTKNGAATAELIDKNSLEWYDSIKSLAISANKEELLQKNFITKLNVIALRQFFSLDEIEKMNSKEIFAFTVNKSFYAQQSINEYTVAGTEIKDGKAAVLLKQDEKLVGIPLKFIKEEDGWKINLASAINFLNKIISGNPWGNQYMENDSVLKQVESVYKNPLKENIWEPLKKNY